MHGQRGITNRDVSVTRPILYVDVFNVVQKQLQRGKALRADCGM